MSIEFALWVRTHRVLIIIVLVIILILLIIIPYLINIIVVPIYIIFVIAAFVTVSRKKITRDDLERIGLKQYFYGELVSASRRDDGGYDAVYIDRTFNITWKIRMDSNLNLTDITLPQFPNAGTATNYSRFVKRMKSIIIRLKSGYDFYFTVDPQKDGGKPYKILVNKKDKDVSISAESSELDFYIDLVKEYKNVKELWEKDGNVLLQLDDGKFAHIGIEIYEFRMELDEARPFGYLTEKDIEKSVLHKNVYETRPTNEEAKKIIQSRYPNSKTYGPVSIDRTGNFNIDLTLVGGHLKWIVKTDKNLRFIEIRFWHAHPNPLSENIYKNRDAFNRDLQKVILQNTERIKVAERVADAEYLDHVKYLTGPYKIYVKGNNAVIYAEGHEPNSYPEFVKEYHNVKNVQHSIILELTGGWNVSISDEIYEFKMGSKKYIHKNIFNPPVKNARQILQGRYPDGEIYKFRHPNAHFVQRIGKLSWSMEIDDNLRLVKVRFRDTTYINYLSFVNDLNEVLQEHKDRIASAELDADSEYSGYTKYLARAYKVYVGEDSTEIYAEGFETGSYDELIKEYKNVKEHWNADGSTVILRMSENRFVRIESEIYEFSTEKFDRDDPFRRPRGKKNQVHKNIFDESLTKEQAKNIMQKRYPDGELYDLGDDGYLGAGYYIQYYHRTENLRWRIRTDKNLRKSQIYFPFMYHKNESQMFPTYIDFRKRMLEVVDEVKTARLADEAADPYYPDYDKYFTHDNGGRPFKVYVHKKTQDVAIFENDYERGEYNLVKEYKNVKKAWIGTHEDQQDRTWPSFALGNSILLHLNDDRYVQIGEDVVEFEMNPGEKVVKYVSNIYGSDVPYPYTVTNKNLWIRGSYIKLSDLPTKLPVDSYDFIWNDEIPKHEGKSYRFVVESPFRK